jgi:curved DNA-binding protein
LTRIDDVAEVRVLPGTRDGELIRERGLGHAGAFGGPYGDLCVTVRVEAPLEEEQVQVLPLGVAEALLGAKVEVTTPQGLVRLAIPACTSSGARLRLRGKGADRPGGPPGDLLLEVQIVVPERLDPESQALIEQFAKLNPHSPR